LGALFEIPNFREITIALILSPTIIFEQALQFQLNIHPNRRKINPDNVFLIKL
jgi:hypothetical protein